MGPNVHVPATSAGGAVDEPLPSTSTSTSGWNERKPSDHRAMRLFIVSEPMLLILPETRRAGRYSGRFGSTVTPADQAVPVRTRLTRAAGATRRRVMRAIMESLRIPG